MAQLAQSLRRSSSRNCIKRSESAPTLAPVWEPDGGEHEDTQAPYFHSVTGAFGSGVAPPRAPLKDPTILAKWLELLCAMAVESHEPRGYLREHELAETVQRSLSAGSTMKLHEGLVEQRYELKRQLSNGRSFKVMEGVHRQTQKNHSLKIVSLCQGGLRVTRAFDTMQAFHMICSFVDEVFCHPRYVCICMKWGMHEVDSSHQLSKWIVESARVLLEVLPPKQQKSARYLRLSALDVQHLLLRSTALDLYLQDNLFIE
ncbi:hypothetical protein AB1Y20_012178 [Prymnesium parvum]|uniref:Uncharacterized protein n=1 Tax=Prymnesium parvum TaxID=97485 RepID=A0AB34INN0_PRYPA